MKEKRTTILMSILLVVLGGYLAKPYIEGYFSKVPDEKKALEPLAGKNEIKNISIVKNSEGLYEVSVEYFYKGNGQRAWIQAAAVSPNSQKTNYYGEPKFLERGEGKVSIELQRPWDGYGEVVTRKVFVTMSVYGEKSANAGDQKELDYIIEWPEGATYLQQREMAKKSVDQLYNEAVTLIDSGSGDNIEIAKKNLETLLLKDPNYVLAYPELARVAMKSNWGTEGLKQAEAYLNSGLRLDPDNANVNVLLGYVYTHQKRYTEAEKCFVKSEGLRTKNLWLWTNWGELLEKQNKLDLAKEKYLVAINSPRAFDSHDRAKINAYRFVFSILENQQKFDEMNSLYKKRAEEFEKYPCYYADYGQFRVTHFGDFEGGIANSKRAIDSGCTSNEARNSLGVSYYLAWYKKDGVEADGILTQANIFLPSGPAMLYELAKNGETSKIIPKLLKNGLSIKTEDNQKYNAMAYAIYGDNAEAARQLARYGARFDDLITEAKFPVGLVAFEHKNIQIIKIMKNSGVDFSKLRYGNMSALQYAEKLGDKDIIDVVKGSHKYDI